MKSEIRDLLPVENRLLWSEDEEVRFKPRRKPNRHVEGEIQSAVLAYLRIHPLVAWAERFNTGAVKLQDRHGKQRFVRFAFTGCSDILGQMKDGRFLAIEVKAPSGRLSVAQRAFLDMVKGYRGVAGVVRSVDDIDVILGDFNEHERKD